ncbi:hypothetical protein C2845_PM11G10860 [Panicum miliaceum]|uniref:Uncharacterized protein n=1 Tax=Panicum miliaceum TaxID=4540 RepID=A0A3L6RT81_PANMI|nr:hypothetical protein C2845_PM11G10860 [Panicum miliaceum]
MTPHGMPASSPRPPPGAARCPRHPGPRVVPAAPPGLKPRHPIGCERGQAEMLLHQCLSSFLLTPPAQVAFQFLELLRDQFVTTEYIKLEREACEQRKPMAKPRLHCW